MQTPARETVNAGDSESGLVVERRFTSVNKPVQEQFEWSETEFLQKCADYLSQLKTGSTALLRQLNNHKDWIDIFKTHFKENKSFDSYWQTHDRSMFYDDFRLYIKK